MTGILEWGRFVGVKLLRLLSLLAGVSVVAFILMQFSPVDPIEAYIGGDMIRVSAEQRSLIEERWGLNDPPAQRLFNWGQALLQGDLGTSMIYRQPVADIIQERFLNSVALMAVAWLLSGLIGFSLGVVAAMKRESVLDRMISWYCYTLASTPVFWMALLLLMVFGVWLGWLPVGLGVPAGMAADQVTWTDRAVHMVLPALTLSLTGVAAIALHTRQKLLDVLDSDYILFARARGERGMQLFRRHGFRHVVLPALTLQFASFSELFGGAVLAEQVFSYPGLGQATVQAGLRGDVPLLLGLVLCSTIFVFTGNLLADILYRFIDPRMKEELLT
ncbi:ABC transporter permease [Paenibacillus illinoisensis]|uniref:ABC transporter permease n=1 Tax=Paenibacillus illinoisensis TaxID=59845 RepID=A0ABW8HSM0_9BACL